MEFYPGWKCYSFPPARCPVGPKDDTYINRSRVRSNVQYSRWPLCHPFHGPKSNNPSSSFLYKSHGENHFASAPSSSPISDMSNDHLLKSQDITGHIWFSPLSIQGSEGEAAFSAGSMAAAAAAGVADVPFQIKKEFGKQKQWSLLALDSCWVFSCKNNNNWNTGLVVPPRFDPHSTGIFDQLE